MQRLSHNSEKYPKSESRKDIRIKNNTNDLTENESELKVTGKPNPGYSLSGQRNNNNTGAIPKVYSGKHKKHEKRSKKELNRRDKTENKDNNKSDKDDLLAYFKAVKSTTEGDEPVRKIEHRPSSRERKRCLSSNPHVDRPNVNTKDRKLRQSTPETTSQFAVDIETMADQVCIFFFFFLFLLYKNSTFFNS